MDGDGGGVPACEADSRPCGPGPASPTIPYPTGEDDGDLHLREVRNERERHLCRVRGRAGRRHDHHRCRKRGAGEQVPQRARNDQVAPVLRPGHDLRRLGASPSRHPWSSAELPEACERHRTTRPSFRVPVRNLPTACRSRSSSGSRTYPSQPGRRGRERSGAGEGAEGSHRRVRLPG